MVKYQKDEGEDSIRNWMRTKNTIQFLGAWESINNKDFKPVEFDRFKNKAGENSFNMRPKKWIEATNAIGIISKSGRYGGTYAHKDIAYHFAMWMSPLFQLLIIKEFDRLKEQESKYLNQTWDYRRFLTKVNYKMHTDAIQENIIPKLHIDKKLERYVYADEAEILNYALFGMTSKQWRQEKPSKSFRGEKYEGLCRCSPTYRVGKLRKL